MGVLDKVPDYYQALQLPFGASAEAIKQSFRRLAKTHHPDIPETGSKLEFQKILSAYQVLSSSKREGYDELYRKLHARARLNQHAMSNPMVELANDRIQFPTTIYELARRGLMRKGFRTRDRRRFTGIHYDLVIHILPEELSRRVLVSVPLTVRSICQICYGSDLNCPSCNGSGSHKSSRKIKIEFTPGSMQNGRIFELDLSRFRPDPWTHFKKKTLIVKLQVIAKNIVANTPNQKNS